jgi:TRAP-type uncharacterized transport system substrate-binding protein
MISPLLYLSRAHSRLVALFGQGLVQTVGVILLMVFVIAVGIFAFVNATAPTSITITSGPAGSSFARNAERYKKILEREGVKVHILPSEGSVENFKRLNDPKVKVDVGFVLGGSVNGANTERLVSLGSVAYQPLMVFYTGSTRRFLSEFKGKRLDIDDEGSGTHMLALTLLKANGIEPGDGTQFTHVAEENPQKALLSNRADAVFVMGDSTSSDAIQQLLRTPGIQLLNFEQATGYARRIPYLNKLFIPQGALDFGKNVPDDDVYLVAPSVELIARDTLHPALSDVLLEAAKEVHSKPGLFRKRGEFPAPMDSEIALSSDATRFYTSGKSYLYRTFPFWLASLIARTLVVIVPIVLLLIPALKMAPAIYRWRIQSRINRWYKVLLELERDAFKPHTPPERQAELLRQLDHIESAVNRIEVPAAFGDMFYVLREHINFVRDNLIANKASQEHAATH